MAMPVRGSGLPEVCSVVPAVAGRLIFRSRPWDWEQPGMPHRERGQNDLWAHTVVASRPGASEGNAWADK